MNWLVFAVVAWVLFGLELGLRELLSIGPGGVSPSFVVPLLVFVGLSAPPRTVLWAGASLGLVSDLLRTVDVEGGAVATVVGPGVIGFTMAGYALIAVRPLLYRRNPLTIAVLSGACVMVAEVVVVALTGVRGSYDELAYSPGPELVVGMLSGLYSVASGGLVSLGLLPLTDLFRFQHGTPGFGRRPAR